MIKSGKMLALFLIVLLLAGCGGGGSSSNSGGGGTGGGSGGVASEPNVLAVTVGNDPSYPNKPTVSVTVCTPGTSNCQTINNILLDTGSYGLRIFKQALPGVSLPQVTIGSGSLAECVMYADGSGDWGSVHTADIVLGGDTASNAPIQVIDATFFDGAIPPACQSPNVVSLDQSPDSAGFNGILGVGLFAADCGQGCTSSSNNGMYYTCRGSGCVGTAVPIASQVQNPVGLLIQDNNGVIVQLPSVPLGGVPKINGQLILGIGTRSNNIPSGVTVYPVNSSGEFTTVFNGATLNNSFIDSGSNGLFFNDTELPVCSTGQGWFCPKSTQSLSAINTGYAGTPNGLVSFKIGNASNLFSNSSNSVFIELGGPAPVGIGFDWGLPFFLGRHVLVGIEGTSSSLGNGPFWAY